MTEMGLSNLRHIEEQNSIISDLINNLRKIKMLLKVELPT